MILAANHVLPMDCQPGKPLSPGWVEVQGDRIVRVEEGTAPAGATNLGACILLPGLINGHCHLDYTLAQGQLSRGQSFVDWIAQINALKRLTKPAEFETSIRQGFEQLVDFGTTSVVNIESLPELARRIPAPIRTWWAIEGIDVSAPFGFPDLIPLAAVSPHAPYTSSARLYRAAKHLAEYSGALFTTHVGESLEENEMFCRATGLLYDLMTQLNRDMTDCGHGTSLGLLLEESLIPRRSILAHVNHFALADLMRCHAEGHSVVHCPQSHAFFGHRFFHYEALCNAGVNVLLGTDSLASAQSLSLFVEMRLFRENHPAVSAEECLRKVTTDAARALGWEREIGRLKPGWCADLIAVPDRGGDPFASVIACDTPVPLVMASGKILRSPF